MLRMLTYLLKMVMGGLHYIVLRGKFIHSLYIVDQFTYPVTGGPEAWDGCVEITIICLVSNSNPTIPTIIRMLQSRHRSIDFVYILNMMIVCVCLWYFVHVCQCYATPTATRPPLQV